MSAFSYRERKSESDYHLIISITTILSWYYQNYYNSFLRYISAKILDDFHILVLTSSLESTMIIILNILYTDIWDLDISIINF